MPRKKFPGVSKRWQRIRERFGPQGADTSRRAFARLLGVGESRYLSWEGADVTSDHNVIAECLKKLAAKSDFPVSEIPAVAVWVESGYGDVEHVFSGQRRTPAPAPKTEAPSPPTSVQAAASAESRNDETREAIASLCEAALSGVLEPRLALRSIWGLTR